MGAVPNVWDFEIRLGSLGLARDAGACLVVVQGATLQSVAPLVKGSWGSVYRVINKATMLIIGL